MNFQLPICRMLSNTRLKSCLMLHKLKKLWNGEKVNIWTASMLKTPIQDGRSSTWSEMDSFIWLGLPREGKRRSFSLILVDFCQHPMRWKWKWLGRGWIGVCGKSYAEAGQSVWVIWGLKLPYTTFKLRYIRFKLRYVTFHGLRAKL